MDVELFGLEKYGVIMSEQFSVQVMQFGIMLVSDIICDFMMGIIFSEQECIKVMMVIVVYVEEVGFDVFVIGEYYNLFFWFLSFMIFFVVFVVQIECFIVFMLIIFIMMNDFVCIVEEYVMLQYVFDGCMDFMFGCGNIGFVYLWFGQDICQGFLLVIENYVFLYKLWCEDVVDWEGKFCILFQGFILILCLFDGIVLFVWYGFICMFEIVEQVVYYGDGFFVNNIFWLKEYYQCLIELYWQCFEYYGYGICEQVIVGFGGQVFMVVKLQDVVNQFCLYFDNVFVYGYGLSMEDFIEMILLMVGLLQQVIDWYVVMCEYYGDYQCQLFFIDYVGLLLKIVFEQFDIFGFEVVFVLCKEFVKDWLVVVLDVLIYVLCVKVQYGDGFICQVCFGVNWGDNLIGDLLYQDMFVLVGVVFGFGWKEV